MLLRQKKLLGELESAVNMPIAKPELIRDLQAAIDELEDKGFQQILKAQSITKEAKAPGWSILGGLKKVFSFLIGISIVNLIAFPKPPSMYPDTIESMDRVEVTWNRTERLLIASQPTQTMKDELMLELARERLAIKREEEQAREKEGDQRVKDYVK